MNPKEERQRALVNLLHPGAAPAGEPQPVAGGEPKPKPTSFDGGARQTPPMPKTAEEAAREHGQWLAEVTAVRRATAGASGFG